MNAVVSRPRAPAVDAVSVAGLVATGILVGGAAPFMRAATQHRVGPLLWLLTTTSIASVVLGATMLARRAALPVGPRHLAFYAAAGLFSIALPNVLLFAATRALGAATASLAYALPPVMTAALVFLTRIERPDARRVAGVAIGLVGAMAALLPGKSLPSNVPPIAALSLFLVPLSLAIGNIVRARFAPEGSDPLANATGTTLAGVAWLASALLATSPALATPPLRIVLTLAVPQGTTYALGMVLFFWLQRRAGAVFTAQVGYVATLAGLLAAGAAFDERLTPWSWGAAALIGVGAVVGGGASQSRAPSSPLTPRADERRRPESRRR